MLERPCGEDEQCPVHQWAHHGSDSPHVKTSWLEGSAEVSESVSGVSSRGFQLGLCCPLGDMWPCAGTFWVVTAGHVSSFLCREARHAAKTL